MHERFPTVQRLQYHLPNQQMVLFDDDDDVQEVVARSTISRMMLTEYLNSFIRPLSLVFKYSPCKPPIIQRAYRVNYTF